MTTEGVKKKLVRVAKKENSYLDHYVIKTFCFSIVSSPEKGRRQLTNLQSCRESLCLDILTAIKENYPVDRDHLRLLLAMDVSAQELPKFKEKLFSGKAAINLIEERAGWAPMSTITTAKHEIYSNTWLLTGPAEWMSQPQFVSLAGFIMRIAMSYGPLKTGSFDAFIENLRVLGKSSRQGGDYYHANSLYNTLPLLIDNNKEIFDGIDFKKAWSMDNSDSSFGRECGITTFCREDAPLRYSKAADKTKKIFLEMLKQA